LATEVEEDRRYTIWKIKSTTTNFQWLHVDAEDASVAGKEPGVLCAVISCRSRIGCN
jgi:hypothetical protein